VVVGLVFQFGFSVNPADIDSLWNHQEYHGKELYPRSGRSDLETVKLPAIVDVVAMVLVT
jgi:hypothetical protein